MEICWNLTHCCPFSCKICMVNPVKINDNNKYAIDSKLINSGISLALQDKIKILKDVTLNFNRVKIDFAGGDPLLYEDNLEIIKMASEYFGPENIEISTTGYCITDKILDFLKDKISRLDFTLDTIDNRHENFRSNKYRILNIRAIKLVKKRGIPITVSTVLRKGNMDNENLNSIYKFLTENNISNWFLIRYRPVGRGSQYKSLEPSEIEYKKALDYCFSLQKNIGPKIAIHHTFNELMGIMTMNDSCKIGNKFTILSDGTVISCCWAFNQKGRPLNDMFVLGKLPKDKFETILNSNKLKKIRKIKACRVDNFLK